MDIEWYLTLTPIQRWNHFIKQMEIWYQLVGFSWITNSLVWMGRTRSKRDIPNWHTKYRTYWLPYTHDRPELSNQIQFDHIWIGSIFENEPIHSIKLRIQCSTNSEIYNNISSNVIFSRFYFHLNFFEYDIISLHELKSIPFLWFNLIFSMCTY